jgi:hypothetical protein
MQISRQIFSAAADVDLFRACALDKPSPLTKTPELIRRTIDIYRIIAYRSIIILCIYMRECLLNAPHIWFRVAMLFSVRFPLFLMYYYYYY